jgi:DeoR/GlpR family transcriptional regulator of sugar metabolism
LVGFWCLSSIWATSAVDTHLEVTRRKPKARIERIRELVSQSGVVSLREVMEELGVSEMTARRDFVALEEMGVVKRKHGAVVAVEPTFLPYATRASLESDAKQAIGALAASLVEEGETIMLGGGTTCLAMANALAQRVISVRVVTNSVPAITVLMRNPAVTVIATGGSVGLHTEDMLGPFAEEMLARLQVGKTFFPTSGITSEGVYDDRAEGAAVNRRMVDAAVESFVLADQTKIGRAGFVLMASLERIAGLVTNEPPPEAANEWLRGAGVNVRAASPSRPGVGESELQQSSEEPQRRRV